MEAVGMGNSLGGAFPPRSVPGKLVAPSWKLEASVPRSCFSSCYMGTNGVWLCPHLGGVALKAVDVTLIPSLPIFVGLSGLLL